MIFKGNLPVTALTKKYLAAKLQLHPKQDAWQLNEKSLWGTVMCQMMTKSFIYADASDKEMDDFPERLPIIFPGQNIHQGYFHWTLRHSIKLGSFVKQHLYDELYTILEANNKKHGDIKRIILSYMEHYNLDDDDISYETMVKWYYRARKNSEKRLINVVRNVR